MGYEDISFDQVLAVHVGSVFNVHVSEPTYIIESQRIGPHASGVGKQMLSRLY
jgi:hypothetical protein